MVTSLLVISINVCLEKCKTNCPTLTSLPIWLHANYMLYFP